MFQIGEEVTKRVLVIGDSCIDAFEYGRCERICPDAPVPVFIPTNVKVNGGMASNVAANLKALGVEVDLITNEEKIVKTRYIDEKTNHMFLRVDSNDDKIKPINHSVMLNEKYTQQYDAVVVSDYDKGFLNHADIAYFCVNHPKVFIDTKKDIGLWQKDAFLIKINNVEFNKSKRTIDLQNTNLVVTMGNEGAVYMKTGETFPVRKVEVKDMTGAGDTFLAGLVAKYLETESVLEGIKFGNECATEVVQKRGVSVVEKK